MISYIKGELMGYDGSTVTLLNNSIGFSITCSQSALCRLINENGGGVWTYMAVREDEISLYGFDSIAEKNMFLKLITVSGVGPKIGMTVLSGMNINDLAYCIASSDVKTLSKIKGLGKKMAERIIVELREVMSALDLEPVAKKNVEMPNEEENNAIMALMSLGYTRQVSSESVKMATLDGAKTLEEIITIALKNMK